MPVEGKPGTAPEGLATNINMEYSPQAPGTAPAAGYPSQIMAPPYSANAEGPYMHQPEGWNPAVFPPPPPYSDTGYQQQPIFAPQVIFKTDLADNPGLAVCPACNQPCTTTIKYKSGCLTTLLCCLLFFFGCVLGCFLIPCCVKSCKDVDHYCPNCQHLIYKYKRL
ncbi:lipopolysaccharide-induced tumor necrosis factor-alpha factor homolog [Bufo bufo]|uniref:lipopolysaccharide-induced tumor necrosis factor-alpha factor homolog n=1 Tax=Bufo bufo TaxID=8384 RepID=UPI001ABDC3CA|nr:lipopolysaccharide-induced tumor necrosis factor-alpha factor homolog [Bufo bufo]